MAKEAVEAEGGVREIVAPQIGGIADSGGKRREARQKVNGGPSVLYDAVAIVLSESGCKILMEEATAKDFVSDAFAHAKFIAFSKAAQPLLQKAGAMPDEGCMAVSSERDAAAFIKKCGQLRYWDREARMHKV